MNIDLQRYTLNNQSLKKNSITFKGFSTLDSKGDGKPENTKKNDNKQMLKRLLAGGLVLAGGIVAGVYFFKKRHIKKPVNNAILSQKPPILPNLSVESQKFFKKIENLSPEKKKSYQDAATKIQKFFKEIKAGKLSRKITQKQAKTAIEAGRKVRNSEIGKRVNQNIKTLREELRGYKEKRDKFCDELDAYNPLKATLKKALKSAHPISETFKNLVFCTKQDIKIFLRKFHPKLRKEIGSLPWSEQVPDLNRYRLSKIVSEIKDKFKKTSSKRSLKNNGYKVKVKGEEYKINYIGEGGFGHALKINVNGKDYVIKIFKSENQRNDVFNDPIYFRHGDLIEPNIAAFMKSNRTQAYRNFAEFHFADLNEGFMITEFIDNNKKYNQYFKKEDFAGQAFPYNCQLRLQDLLCGDAHKRNMIGQEGYQKLVDYGAIYPFDNNKFNLNNNLIGSFIGKIIIPSLGGKFDMYNIM